MIEDPIIALLTLVITTGIGVWAFYKLLVSGRKRRLASLENRYGEKATNEQENAP